MSLRPIPIPTALLLLLLFASQSVSAQDSLKQLLDSSGYPADTKQGISALFEEAARREVPRELILPRLQEGIAKNVPPGRVVAALQRDLSNLLEARKLLLEIDNGDRIQKNLGRWARAANLIAAGRSPQEVRALAESSVPRPEAFREATVLYVSLTKWGLSRELALRVVQAAVDSRLSADELPGIAELFAVARQRRIRPERMVERIVVALAEAGSLRRLRSMVVE